MQRVNQQPKSLGPMGISAVRLRQSNWVKNWCDELVKAHLPGPDFLLNGFTADCGSWLPRVAETSDLERAYKVLLTLEPIAMSADKAAQHTAHGLRHVYPTALAQLGAGTRSLELSGRWKRGSAMPKKYDARRCVSELRVRMRVQKAVNLGWRMVKENEVPEPEPRPKRALSSSSSSVAVSPKKAKVYQDLKVELPKEQSVVHFVLNHRPTVQKLRVHGWQSGVSTICGRFKCGTVHEPTKYAVFMDTPNAFTLCDECWSDRV